jgi:hypothetical protein
MHRHYAEVQEVVDAIKARPVPGIRIDGPQRLEGRGFIKAWPKAELL